MAATFAFPEDEFEPEKEPADPARERTEFGELTQLLNRMQAGETSCREEAFRAVYHHLRRLAANCMRREGNARTLQPTALVHEAYLKLAGYNGQLQNRCHYFALAAEAMRRILVDQARARRAARRGGGQTADPFDDNTPSGSTMEGPERVISVDLALQKLEATDPRKARIVEMKYFAGYSEEEIAETLGVHVRTVRREWVLAKAWLYAHLS